MEIKLNAGDKIQVPTGCKATIEDDLIVIEKREQAEFKDGDILRSKNYNRIVIFSNYDRNDKGIFDCYFSSTKDHTTGWFTNCFRHVTEEEKQAFFDDLKAKGLRWNAETKQMERIRNRAENGDKYLYINKNCEVLEMEEDYSLYDDRLYNLGNYYLPSERAQVEEDVKAIKAIFEKRLKAQ